MAVNDDDCVKRIIKAYLYFHGEATSAMIIKHIDSIGYGIRKNYTSHSLTSNIKKWRRTDKSGHWFNVEPIIKNHVIWWRIKK